MAWPTTPLTSTETSHNAYVPLNRHKELLAGMRTTLERLRAKAEASVPQGSEGQAQP